ncbi:MAG: DUF2784 domain-containing protein [Desulfobacterales bacterium]|nr:DUF2784 domain-containing protein [Desulfobacterales bacterium]MBT7697090.1 DUF2784 domain-containing protein [Desulfobacterales bacterium]
MIYRTLADFVVLVHLSFILFTVFGGFLGLLSKRWFWIHLPSVLWAVLIEFTGWICPLTPLENLLSIKGEISVYETGFIENYIVPLIYPDLLSRELQIILGFFALVLNILIYWYVLHGKAKDID